MLQRKQLESLYRRYNLRKFVHPDPLEFLYRYRRKDDREITGLVASSLAYGRVAQILSSVETALGHMGTSPAAFVREASPRQMAEAFSDFKHRMTPGPDMVQMLSGAKRILSRYGSLNACFCEGYSGSDSTVFPALTAFTEQLRCQKNHLVPDPARGSACKRLNLYLRWMIRKDDVDPGGWKGVPASKLIVPLDTHMANIGRALKLTRRKSADMKMAIEITNAYRKCAPDDPVKYDFCLTRFGIRSELDISDLLRRELN